jgi:hypothetical protein
MGQVEGDGDGGGPVGREPFVRQVEVQRERESARPQLAAKLSDPFGQRALDGQGQVGHSNVQQLFVTEIDPVITQRPARHGDNGIVLFREGFQ